MITAQHIHKSYGNLHVLNDVSVDIHKEEIVAITGASGAGKSTLLHILGTLDKADSGTLTIEKTEVLRLSDKKLSAFRNKNIGFVFQFHHLLPEFTALENICIPAFIAGQKKKEAIEKAMELLCLLKIEERATHKPSQLSGGEQQRVAIARALINNPAIILADEPSGNLDSKSAHELHQLFLALRENLKKTFVIVTHNTQLAQMSDRILDMKDGKIV
ncbi:MAG: ABC transporter ATP-binding protein [Bacteroidales bacterium]|nr:ABC transporter ATP-binding protein [Bacteroidales bacterium]